MPDRLIIPALVMALLCSAAVMWSGAGSGNSTATAVSAAAFVATVLLVAWRMNERLWSGRDHHGDSLNVRKLSALRRNARMAVLIYAWGALAMFAAYKLSGLYWQHGLQYSAAMLLFAVGIFAWVHYAAPGSRLAQPEGVKRAQQLNLVHGAAATSALAFLIGSGKLWANRADWVANQVFLFGLGGIVALCALAVLAQRRIERQG